MNIFNKNYVKTMKTIDIEINKHISNAYNSLCLSKFVNKQFDIVQFSLFYT